MFNRNFLFKTFLLALLIKGIIFIVFSISFHDNWKRKVTYLFVSSKDYSNYIVPAERLIDEGEMYQPGRGGSKLYNYKMPGMVPIYGPLYWMFGQSIALQVLIILQFLADIFSVILLALIAAQLLNSIKIFWLTFFIYALSTSVSLYTHFALSELFCTFFIIVSVFYFLKAITTKRWVFYLISGFFITWAIFFRSSSGIFLAIYPLLLLLSKIKSTSFISVIKKLTIFFIPFVLLESGWIIRNYNISHKFIPLENTLSDFGSPQMKSAFRVIQSWGGDIGSWNPKSEGKWFFHEKYKESISIDELQKFSFPNHLLQKPGFIDSLSLMKKNYTMSLNKSLSKYQRDSVLNLFTNNIDVFIQQYKSDYPFRYYVIAPLKLMAQLVFPTDNYNLPFITNSFIHKLLRIVSLLYYYIIVISAIIGIFISLLYEKNIVFKCLALFPVLHVLVLGGILRYAESRYIIPVFPILSIFSAYFIYVVIEKFFSSKQTVAQ